MPKAIFEGIYRDLKGKIQEGTYSYQELLPSEGELTAEYGCSRNTLRRVEVAAPILDEKIKARVIDMFDLMLTDNVQARVMRQDGSYARRMPGEEEARNTQEMLYQQAYDAVAAKTNA